MQPTLRHTPPRAFLFLDQNHLLAEVGRAESGGVSAGAGAEHDDFGVDVTLHHVNGGNGRRLGCGRRSGGLRGGLAGGGSGCGSAAFHHQEHGTFAHFVAHFDLELFHYTGDGRRHIHGCLVCFQRNERLLFLDFVACFDGYFDDGDVLEIPDVRDFDFNGLAHDYFLYYIF